MGPAGVDQDIVPQPPHIGVLEDPVEAIVAPEFLLPVDEIASILVAEQPDDFRMLMKLGQGDLGRTHIRIVGREIERPGVPPSARGTD